MEKISAGKETTIVRLDSEFNDTCEAELTGLLQDCISRSVRWMALDFSGVFLFDNTAINTLVKLCVGKANVRLVAAGLNQKQRDIFQRLSF